MRTRRVPPAEGQPIRVLVVEDSAITRELIVDLLEEHPLVKVVGTASTGAEGVAATHQLHPDLITLDLGLPDFDGFEVLRRVMSECPTPVLVLTATLRPRGRREAFWALNLGAVHVMEKPTATEYESPIWRTRLHRELQSLARVPVIPHMRSMSGRPVAQSTPLAAPLPSGRADSRPEIIVIGASAGGAQAVTALLSALPLLPVPVIFAQHMGPNLHLPLARYLASATIWPVTPIDVDMRLEPGRIYVAPGRKQLELTSRGDVRVFEFGESVRSSYAPNLDHLFRSVARIYGSAAVGVILSGMGQDGAQGLLELYRAGAFTLGQDAATCVVYGMPRVAHELGGVAVQLAPAAIGATIAAWVETRGARSESMR